MVGRLLGLVRRAYRAVVPLRVRMLVRRVYAAARERWAPPPSKLAFRVRLPVPPVATHRRSGPFRILRRPPAAAVWIDAPPSMYVGGVLRRQGLEGYEPEAVSCFLAAVSASGARTVFDIGANVGLYTLLTASLTPARVVAFEPEPHAAATVTKSLRVDRLPGRVEAVAVGAAAGSARLFLSDTTDASNSLRAGFRTAKGSIDVPLITLDSFCRRTRLWPDLLKIDTETTEPDVLRGAGAVLRRRPWILCEVLPGGAADEIEAILGPFGYHWYQIAGLPPTAREGITGFESIEASNWLFLPDEAPSGLWETAGQWRKRISAVRPVPKPAPTPPAQAAAEPATRS